MNVRPVKIVKSNPSRRERPLSSPPAIFPEKKLRDCYDIVIVGPWKEASPGGDRVRTIFTRLLESARARPFLVNTPLGRPEDREEIERLSRFSWSPPEELAESPSIYQTLIIPPLDLGEGEIRNRFQGQIDLLPKILWKAENITEILEKGERGIDLPGGRDKRDSSIGEALAREKPRGFLRLYRKNKKPQVTILSCLPEEGRGREELPRALLDQFEILELVPRGERTRAYQREVDGLLESELVPLLRESSLLVLPGQGGDREWLRARCRMSRLPTSRTVSRLQEETLEAWSDRVAEEWQREIRVSSSNSLSCAPGLYFSQSLASLESLLELPETRRHNLDSLFIIGSLDRAILGLESLLNLSSLSLSSLCLLGNSPLRHLSLLPLELEISSRNVSLPATLSRAVQQEALSRSSSYLILLGDDVDISLFSRGPELDSLGSPLCFARASAISLFGSGPLGLLFPPRWLLSRRSILSRMGDSPVSLLERRVRLSGGKGDIKTFPLCSSREAPSPGCLDTSIYNIAIGDLSREQSRRLSGLLLSSDTSQRLVSLGGDPIGPPSWTVQKQLILSGDIKTSRDLLSQGASLATLSRYLEIEHDQLKRSKLVVIWSPYAWPLFKPLVEKYRKPVVYSALGLEWRRVEARAGLPRDALDYLRRLEEDLIGSSSLVISNRDDIPGCSVLPSGIDFHEELISDRTREIRKEIELAVWVGDLEEDQARLNQLLAITNSPLSRVSKVHIFGEAQVSTINKNVIIHRVRSDGDVLPATSDCSFGLDLCSSESDRGLLLESLGLPLLSTSLLELHPSNFGARMDRLCASYDLSSRTALDDAMKHSWQELYKTYGLLLGGVVAT